MKTAQWLRRHRHAGATHRSRLLVVDTLERRDLAAGALTDAEIERILFIREEEKLARDVYLTFAEQYSDQVFDNIARSEQKHMDAVAGLINTYQLEDPVLDDTRGVYTNPVFTQMYEDLVDKGSRGIIDAYQVGQLIEVTDIDDLAIAIDSSDHADIDLVYQNLLKGSNNHLAAFTSHIGVVGDSNQDGVFDSNDLMLVMQSGEYEDGVDNNSSYVEGDWNGDGDFDTTDFVFALQNSSYES
ncbi:MAG: DUF2202 domain-containing protein [Planctomycetales bacterium]|nr:DUF2202 domain-containing protein [Planctomycetales bacterium]MCA9170477.1 DUF2202 domain-containing protein [Planctomycetales bacterium]